MSAQNTLRERAAALLTSGEVSCFVGWESGRFENQTTPLVCSAPEAAERLVFDEYCVNNLAKYVLDLKARGKVGLVVRGCDARAIQRMMDDNQIKREDVYLIGVGCPTMKDRKTGTILNKCKYCQHRNPHLFDEMAGGPTVDESGEGRFEQAELVEGMDRAARQAFFNAGFDRCLRCYACRNVCPCCTCRTCFVDQRHVGWQGKQNNLNENRFYGLVRAFHIADRCIECGECERACPMDLPLMKLNRKVIQDMNDLFGEFESALSLEDTTEPLIEYRLDDVEEFM